MTAQPDDAIRRKRLLFRAQRRGFKEVDLVFGAFAEAHLATLDRGQLDRFEALLDAADQDVWLWIQGSAPAPAEHDNDVLALLKNYRENAGSPWTA